MIEELESSNDDLPSDSSSDSAADFLRLKQQSYNGTFGEE